MKDKIETWFIFFLIAVLMLSSFAGIVIRVARALG